ncbi:conjugal transfer protein TraF [Colwellia sp. RSH04]|uniref:conjugal transfer protein TraF n=1 Tax=Colwellia sp. RSH04 TaxID=2305464 RepID=UPI000E574D3C|nr:conjugal transfer protein TraF [Colwellia sp. RSH04]RHW76603.1 hypothetical protein D1094_05805 [Colwellia sp. RSH04]
MSKSLSSLLLKKTKRISHLPRRLGQASFAIFILTSSATSMAENFNARRAGQGFTGITLDYTNALSNPALLTEYTSKDDFYFSLNLGILASDEFNVIDKGGNVAQDLATLSDGINAGIPSDILNTQVDSIIHELQAINSQVVSGQNGLSFQVIVPNKYLSFGLFTNQYGRYNGVINYNQTDEQLLRNAIDSGDLKLDELKSTATGIGYSIAEAGVMLGGEVHKTKLYDVSAGIKLKYQRIDLLFNTKNISDFNDNDFDLGNEDNITDDSNGNIDLGLYFAWGDERQWHAAVVSNNLISHEVKHPKVGLAFLLETTSIAGLSYQNDWLTLATEFDLTDRESLIEVKASKYASIGAEFTVNNSLQLRLGYRADLNDVDADIMTAGLGISPWDVVSIDIAGYMGDHQTYGAAIEFGLKI